MGAIDYNDDDLVIVVAGKDRGTNRDPWFGLNDQAAAVLDGSRLLRRPRWWRLRRQIRHDMQERAIEREWRRLTMTLDERRPPLDPAHRKALEEQLGFR